jgi:hypothetical protein
MVRKGTLHDGAFQVTVGDVVLRAATDPNTTNATLSIPQFKVDTTYEISVLGTRYAYKGCLIRMESLNNQDLYAALLPGTNMGPAFACFGNESSTSGGDGGTSTNLVTGISHTDNPLKQLHSGVIRLADPGHVVLDITVVGINNATVSLYAYSQYTLRFVSAPTPTAPTTASSPQTAPQQPAPTSAISTPTAAPAPPPSSPVPSATPTSTPSNVPSVSPVQASSSSPSVTNTSSSNSSNSPTASPVSNATHSAPTILPPGIFSVPSTPKTLKVERLQWTIVLDRDDVSAFLENDDNTTNATTATTTSSSTVWTIEQQDVWINVTQEWFDEFYNGGFEPLSDGDGSNTTSTRDRRRLAASVNYGVVPGTMTCTIELLEAHIVNNDKNDTTATLILLYNQQLNYRAFNNSDETTATAKTTAMGPLQYTTLPFRSRTARPVYVERLASSERMAPLWQSLTVETLPVPQILGPVRKPLTDTSSNSATTATDKADSKDDSGWSIGAISGVVVAGLVAVMVGAAAVLYISQRDDGRHDNVASLVPDFERATFSFGGGSGAGASGGMRGSARLAAVSDDPATDLEASSDEVPKPR